MPPQPKILLLLVILFLPCYVLSYPLNQRDGLDPGLGGLLGGDSPGGGGEDEPTAPSESDPEIHPKIPKLSHLTALSSEALGGLSSTTGTTPTNTKITSAQTTSIGTTPSTATTLGSEESTTPTSGTSTPTASIGVTKQAPSTPPGEAAEWKVIGTVTLGIGCIAAVMLCIAFFDSWWGFLLSVFGKRNDGSEDLVPDWVQRDWEYKIASEDGHRYPVLASLESMTGKANPTNPTSPAPNTSPDPRHCLVPTLPLPALLYSPTLDPHPLDPLFRRPSASKYPAQR